MNTNNKKLPVFAKIYLPGLSSERMLVPIAFVAKLNKPFPETVILQCQSGRRWLIEVVKHDEKVYFREGWKKFVRDNNIEIGEILVFSYNGSSTVDVTIIAKSMCEKEEKLLNAQMVKDEDHDADLDCTEDHDDGFQVLEDDNVGEEEDIDECADLDEEHADYCADDNEEEEDLQRRRKKRKSKGTETGESSKSNFVAENYISTSNPYFVPKLSCRHRHLHVPFNILQDFKVKLCSKIEFYDPNGRKWDGHVRVARDGRTLVRGWNVVCRCNHIKKEDYCICELLLGKWSTCLAIKVHVVRPQGIHSS